MRFDISISEKELDDITVQNLAIHRDCLSEEIQVFQNNQRILDDYQRGLLAEYQEALLGIEMTLKYLNNILVKY